MEFSWVDLTCYNLGPSGGDVIQTDTLTIDLGSPENFAMWVTIGFVTGNSSGGGPWDYDNAIITEIYQIDLVLFDVAQPR
jgi:hypothetical protein